MLGSYRRGRDRMNDRRLQSLVHGVALAVIIGWVLHVGQQVLVPIVFSVLVAYLIGGLARAIKRVPLLGPHLPVQLRYLLSILSFGLVVGAGVSLVVSNLGAVAELAPRYQDQLLNRFQQAAAYVGLEAAPTWTALREDFLERSRLQELIGATVVSLTGLAVTLLLVFLYVTFLLLEQRDFSTKFDQLSGNPVRAARVRKVISSINARIGQYLAIKTLINVVLGLVSWAVLAAFDVEFAAFWAVLIAVLNYIPYIGSFLGVLFPVGWALVQSSDPTSVLTLLVLLSLAQFVIGSFLDPYLMGSSLNLSPFVILVSLACWGSLWGVAGAFLAVPITAVLVIVLSEFDGTRPLAILMSRDPRMRRLRGSRSPPGDAGVRGGPG